MRGVLVVVVLSAAALLAGCASDDGLAGRYGTGQGYVSGDGQYLELPPDERGEPVTFAGPTVDGGELDSADLRGQVVVVNFWYATCPPCIYEAPFLAELSQELDDVAFVGVNVRDDTDVARVFETTYGIDYPTILDARDVSVQQAFAGDMAPNAVPTTLVLDTEGRVAARISGVIREAGILRDLIETVQESA